MRWQGESANLNINENMKRISLLFLVALVALSCTTEPKVCIISGKVVDRPQSKVVYIAPESADFRVSEDYSKVQIAEDGTFRDTIEFQHSEIYNIVFEDEYQRGSWMPINFMLEDGTIDFTLYPEEFDGKKNIVAGGKLNDRLHYLGQEAVRIFNNEPLQAELDSLFMVGAALSPEMNEWSSKVQSAFDDYRESGDRSVVDSLYKIRETLPQYSAEGQALTDQIAALHDKQIEWRLKQISDQVDEVGLAYILTIMNLYKHRGLPMDEIVELFDSKYREKFAANPMAVMAARNIAALSVAVGQKYVDFSAPDLEGNMVTLSSQIDGKVAVIDLWASWCGPCIQKSISFIPIWEKYKDQGFTIVGVARESGDTKAMESAIERHGFEWLNLVELNDRASIWAKYGAGNSGGKVILVDREGKIVAIDFGAHDLETHLEELL